MEQIEKNYKKIVVFTGLLFFFVLFLFSWVFYKERSLSFDPAFFAFQMVDTKSFSIALGRWGAVFSEFLPWVALQCNSSMKTFLRLFSIAPIVNYTIIFGIIIYLKNYKAVIALMLALSLGFRHAFYYTTAELYFGIALTILLWALIAPETEYSSKVKRNIALAASIVLIYVMSFLHQLTLFTILFVVIAEFISNKRYKDTHLWIIFGTTILWFMIRIFVLTTSAYESAKIPTLSVFMEELPNIQESPSGMYFTYFAIHELWPLFLTFFITWVFLLKMKKWLYFVFLPIYYIGFIILIVVTYYKGESALMYENYYTVFGVFAGVSFSYVLYHSVKEKWRLFWVVPLLVISLSGIYSAHASLTKRVDYIDRLVAYGKKQEKKKFLVSSQTFPWQYGWVNWSLPFETALYSAIDGPGNEITCFSTLNMNKYDSLLNKQNIFLGPEWEIRWFESHNLQKQYFNFPSTGYEKLNTYQTDTSFNEGEFNKNNVKIHSLKDMYYSDADSFIVAEIEIVNKVGKRLSSIPGGSNPTFLSYHVYDEQGTMVIPDGLRSPLELDVLDYNVQSLIVTLPEEPGTYTVEVDMVTEGVRWWGINTRFRLVSDRSYKKQTYHKKP